jgi:hypothetical protein
MTDNQSDPLAQRDSLANLAALILAEHTAIKGLLTDCLERAMHAGDLLIEAKGRLTHGQWLPWIREHCRITPREVQRYTRLAKNRHTIEKCDRPAHLSVSAALALLANPPKGKPAVDLSRYNLDVVATMRAEMAYALALAREAFPDRDNASLEGNASSLRDAVYQRGSWPTAEEWRNWKVPPATPYEWREDPAVTERENFEEEYWKRQAKRRKEEEDRRRWEAKRLEESRRREAKRLKAAEMALRPRPTSKWPPTAEWMRTHPDDTFCPRPTLGWRAKIWREERGIPHPPRQ